MNHSFMQESRFDPVAGGLSAYFSQLFILVREDSLQYCILDSERNMFIALADYHLNTPAGKEDIFEAELDKVISGDEFLHRKYPAVVVAIDSPYHTLVPASLYESGRLQIHLSMNFDLPTGLSLHSDHLPEADAWHVFAVPGGLPVLMKKHFTQGILVHAGTSLLKSLAVYHKRSPGHTHFYLNLHKRSFDLAVFEENRILFFNTFDFEVSEDILYYALYAAEQLQLRPQNIMLHLCGELARESALLPLLREYVAEVSFLDRPGIFGYSPLFDFPAHRYQSLFGLPLCGS